MSERRDGQYTPNGLPADFFSSLSMPRTPDTNAPADPFASSGHNSTDGDLFGQPSVTTNLINRAPATKRKRIEIEPISVDRSKTENVFTSRPPLTPTSPMVAPPNFSFPLTPTTPTRLPTTPFGLSQFTEDLDCIMDFSNQEVPFTEEEVQSFLEVIGTENAMTPQTGFVPSLMLPDGELEEGTLASVVKRIKALETTSENLRDQLEHLRYEQRQLMVPVPQAEFQKISAEANRIMLGAQEVLDSCTQVLNSYHVSPRHLHQLSVIEQEVEFILTKVNLYMSELVYISSGSLTTTNEPCFCALFISKQPFPKAIKQNIKSASGATEEPIVVELIKAPKSDCRPLEKVKAVMSLLDQQCVKKGRRISLSMQNDQQTMNREGSARFPDLRFLHGTRLMLAQCAFGVKVEYLDAGTVRQTVIESRVSRPFIVMTNENQWESSAGLLLKHDLFQEQLSEISWCRFANLLQRHYIRATRQEISDPTRPLSRYDLEYIRVNQFGGAETVNVTSFTKFWDWFGKVMHGIRHHKPFLFLWLKGLVYGFISKEDAERLLDGQPVGTFVTRFSERRPGQIAIAFSKKDPITGRIGIKHYLYDPQTNQIKNLPDFCRGKVNLCYLPKLKTEYISTGGNIHSIVHKDEAFREYYTTPDEASIPGYVDEV